MFSSIFWNVFIDFFTSGGIILFISMTAFNQPNINLLRALMALELLILAIAILFIVSAMTSQSLYGGFLLFFLLALAGAESAIGLALIMLYYKLNPKLDFSSFWNLKY